MIIDGGTRSTLLGLTLESNFPKLDNQPFFISDEEYRVRSRGLNLLVALYLH